MESPRKNEGYSTVMIEAPNSFPKVYCSLCTIQGLRHINLKLYSLCSQIQTSVKSMSLFVTVTQHSDKG